MSRLLAFSGSSRKGSYNRRVLDYLVRQAQAAGAEVNTLDLAGLDIPIYHGDIESAEGSPPGARELRLQIESCDGMIVACPEYNGFVTPLLLNSLDWASRLPEGGAGPRVFANKTVLVASASPGAFGGMRAAGHLRTLLSGMGCIVLPASVVVPTAASAFNEDGSLANDQVRQRAEYALGQLLEVTGKLT